VDQAAVERIAVEAAVAARRQLVARPPVVVLVLLAEQLAQEKAERYSYSRPLCSFFDVAGSRPSND
jgi:hypothetical protein